MYYLLNLEQQTYNVPSVRDLWIPNATLWDEAKITTLFGEHAASIILQVPIIAGQEDNILCWKAIPSGICKTKCAYRQLRIQQRTNFVHIANQEYKFLDRFGQTSLFSRGLKLLLGSFFDWLWALFLEYNELF